MEQDRIKTKYLVQELHVKLGSIQNLIKKDKEKMKQEKEMFKCEVQILEERLQMLEKEHQNI